MSYACRSYDRQNHKEYDVPPVFLIGLMGVDVDHVRPELWENRFVSEYTLFAELAKFKKGEKNSGTFTENYHPIWDDFEALEQGRKEASLMAAKNLKALGVAVDVISQSTGLTV